MSTPAARQRALYVYHLHMGGPDATAVEWRALRSSRFAPRLAQMGVEQVDAADRADIVVLTGLLTRRNLDDVLRELSRVPSPAVVVAAGNEAINGGTWGKLDLSGLEHHSLAHYLDIAVTVPGDPPTPQALIAAIAAAAQLVGRLAERMPSWQEEE